MKRAGGAPARRIAVAITGLLASLGLAACGGVIGGPGSAEVGFAEGGEASGELTISNWPGYIDPGQENSLSDFRDQTGIKVEYIEDVNDNAQFFGKMQPLLDQGQSGNRSIFVVTDWMAKQMADLGYLQQLDHSTLKNVFDNIRSGARSTALDPNRTYTVPWQSGMTGIWVDAAEAPDITSINDLFDPQYKGRVTMLSEMRDTVPLVMKADGVDPQTATKQDWLDAISKIQDAVESGQIRRFTGNDYTEDITAGNAVASIGWSGDGYLISNENAEWRMPDEGCMLWTDNMVIPVGAPNTQAALEYMNFVYQPEIAAKLAAYIQYVTPVEGVADVFKEQGKPLLAKNQLIFPSDQFTQNCTSQVNPPGEQADVDEVTGAFEDIVSG